jgi:type II secretion system protein D
MQRTALSRAPLGVLIFLSALAVAQPLAAQTARPGGSARGVSRSATTTTRSTTGNTAFSGTGPRQYRSNTLLGDAMIQVDPETRSLVIVTDEDTHREMTKVIRELDRPKPQVLIKVVFVEVTWNKGHDIGVEGSYTFGLENARGATTGSQTTTTTTTGTSNNGGTTTNSTTTIARDLGVAAGLAETAALGSLFGGPATGSFVRFVTDDWQATLRALATKGKVEVLSRPSIMARNNQEAVIVVGEEVPFVTNSRITDDGQTINTIQYDNVGIILRVTPFITSDNQVEMIVAPEISQRTSESVPITNDVSVPVIAKRSAETVVVAPNGTTAVIGGLMQTRRVDSVSKVPILGDIPILGFPFRRSTKTDQKTELLIFLTPCIVNSPAQVERISGKELENTELVDQAFTEKDFAKFFDENCVDEIPGKNIVLPATEIRRALPVKASTRVEVKAAATTATPVPRNKAR